MIYLDNSATTSVDPEVLTAFTKVNQNFWGNPSSLHAFGARAEQLLIQAEKQTLSLLNAKQHKVIFTSGATESTNLAIRGVCHAYKIMVVISLQPQWSMPQFMKQPKTWNKKVFA